MEYSFIWNRITDGRPCSNLTGAPTGSMYFYHRDLTGCVGSTDITIDQIDEQDNNYIYLVDQIFVLNTEFIDALVTTVPEPIRKLIRNGKCKLLYDYSRETISSINWVNCLYSAVEKLRIPESGLLVSVSGTGCKQLGKQYANTNNHSARITFIELPYFAIAASLKASVTDDVMLRRFSSASIMKKGICMNQRLSAHRVIFASMLAELGLMPEFYFSLPLIKDGHLFCDAVLDASQMIVDKTKLRGATQLELMLPLVLDDLSDAAQANDPELYRDHTQVFEYYASSLFNIVTETNFFIGTVDQGIVNVFHTEKIFKPMLYLQIPIVVAGPHSVREMRKLGFDMYDDIVDHSYDLILCHETRLAAVVSEISRLNRSYSIIDCQKLYYDTRARARANFDVLLRCHAKCKIDLVGGL